MSRTPAFERATVVRSAMHLFWARGYGGTSVKALVGATGLNPGSIYAAFGSKEGLFREALAAYVENVRTIAGRATVGRTNDGPRERIEAWFFAHIDSALDVDPGSPGRGCLLLNSATEAPMLGDESVEQIRQELTRLETFFHQCVVKARRGTSQEGRPGPAAVARHLVAGLAGISALSRAGADRRQLREVARACLSLV